MKTEIEQGIQTYKKLGFSAIEMAETVNNLNRLLSNAQIHKQRLQQFHWSVKGPEFFELHELFESYYNDMNKYVDVLAERVRIFGKQPVATFAEYLNLCDLKENDVEINSHQMMHMLLADFDVLLSNMMDTLNSANRLGDAGTAAIMNHSIMSLEKKHWMVTAWLSEKPQAPSLS